MRGYGQTDRPEAIEQYTLLHLVGDMVGLLDALGAESAVIAGHDWGAPVAWHAALLRPDRFRGVIGLSVPFRPRGPVRPTSVMPQSDDALFYQLYFQTPGVAEAESNAMCASPSAASSTPPRAMCRAARAERARTPSAWSRGKAGCSPAWWTAFLPPWLTDADMDFYTGEFGRTGFRRLELVPQHLTGTGADGSLRGGAGAPSPRSTSPATAISVVAFRGMDQLIPNLSKFAPGLRGTVILPGCGHGTQQERAREVSAAMIDFLRGL